MTTDRDKSSGAHLRDHGLPARAVRELAAATATLTIDHDVIGVTSSLLIGCTRAVSGAAAGLVLARPDDGQLELLASTSHRAEELELYQLQSAEGPCVDAYSTGRPVTVDTLAQAAARWPDLAERLRAVGFTAVHAAPLLWLGQPLGALNVFFAGSPIDDEVAGIAQTFADIATLAIVHSGQLSTQDVIAHVGAALSERVTIERAKGVLAYDERSSVDAAFDRLLALAAQRGKPLGAVAAEIIDNAADRTP